MFNFFPLLHAHNSSLPTRQPSTHPKHLPRFQTTFIRRTSGHCIGIFRAVTFLPIPHNNKFSVPPNHLTSYYYFFPLLALVQSQASPCDICAGRNGTGTNFCPMTSVPHCQYHYSIKPKLYIH